MESLKFNLTAFTNPTSLMEVNALLDEVLSMVDELGDRLACMSKALDEAECAPARKGKKGQGSCTE